MTFDSKHKTVVGSLTSFLSKATEAADFTDWLEWTFPLYYMIYSSGDPFIKGGLMFPVILCSHHIPRNY